MEKTFWLERWKNKEIGFHKNEYNPSLLSVKDELGLRPGQKVLLPLCGKSLDMLWFANQGLSVVGVEVSPIGCEEFFIENQIPHTRSQKGNTLLYSSSHIQIICGDFFDYQPDETFDLIYDRASNIALPPPLREKYYSKIHQLLTAHTKLCLIALDYEQKEVEGPPFSIPEEETRSAYAGFQVRKLSDQVIEMDNQKFKDAQVKTYEKIYLISNS